MSLSSLYLDAFYACAQTGHFTKAAERLHITQSALSQRILNLESDLEVTLFIRDRSGLRLTEAGEDLLAYCRTRESIEGELLGKIGAVSGTGSETKANIGMSGTIRIGGFSSVMRSVVLPAIAPLLRENPALKLVMITRELSELPTLMRRGEIDFMILDQDLKREDLAVHHLGEEKNVLVEKKGYKGADIYLDHDEEDQVTVRFLRGSKNKAKLERRYLDDVYGLIDGVRLGLGRAVVPAHLIKGESSIQVAADARVMKLPVVLHYQMQPYYTKLHREVVSALLANSERLLD